MKRVVTEDFDVDAVLEELRNPEEGGLVLFFGSVRSPNAGKTVKSLHYEAYEGMAESYIRKVEGEVQEEFGVRRVLVQHRVGDLEPGERTILVAAVGRHRQEAFDACRQALERVKAEIPVWKKEIYRDGEAWVRHRHLEAESRG